MSLLFSAVAGYLIGSFTTGYYLVRLLRGTDVRAQGSGATGARNVGRVLGWTGFWTVFTLDIARGALAVWIAAQIGAGAPGMMLAMVLVTAGHIFPVQLGFRGGKGACVSFGALLVFDLQLALAGAIVCLAILILVRHAVGAFVSAFVLLPLAAFLLGYRSMPLLAVVALLVVIIIGFRDDILRFLRRHHPATVSAGVVE